MQFYVPYVVLWHFILLCIMETTTTLEVAVRKDNYAVWVTCNARRIPEEFVFAQASHSVQWNPSAKTDTV